VIEDVIGADDANDANSQKKCEAKRPACGAREKSRARIGNRFDVYVVFVGSRHEVALGK
jgi:hypothetical protein